MRRAVVITAILMSLLAAFWLGSDTTWDLFPPDFLDYYENHGQRLLQGSLDVDCEAIAWEAFRKDGLCYGYFGPVPAFFRIFLSALLPLYAYHWTLVSTLAGILFTLLVFKKLLKMTLDALPAFPDRERIFIEALLLINVGLGSTLLILTAPVSIYHEAILWGSAFALAATVFLLRYLDDVKLWNALLAATMAASAVHCRTNIGFGALIALALTFGGAVVSYYLHRNQLLLPDSSFVPFRVTQFIRRNLLLTLLVLLIAATPFVWNKLKFGEFSLYPYKYYTAVSPEREARTGRNFVQPGNLFFNIKHYFDPFDIPGSAVFPYIKLAPREWGWRQSQQVHFDTGEPFIPLTGSMLLWVALSMPGLYGMLRGWPFLRVRLIPVLGTLAGGGVVLVLATVAPRYTHDLFPFLILTGTGGLFWVGRLSRKYRLVLYFVGVLITLGSIYLTVAFCLLTPYAGIKVQNKLLVARTLLDGSMISVPVIAAQGLAADNGIIADAASNAWGVILPGDIPPGLAIGARVHFAVSGARKVMALHKQGDVVIAIVDGPLLPSGDGSPAMFKYRRIPCDTVDCGATRLDQ